MQTFLSPCQAWPECGNRCTRPHTRAVGERLRHFVRVVCADVPCDACESPLMFFALDIPRPSPLSCPHTLPLVFSSAFPPAHKHTLFFVTVLLGTLCLFTNLIFKTESFETPTIS